MIQNLDSVVRRLKAGEGTAGLILADTSLRNKLTKSVANIEQGTSRFNENMEAMRTNFLFKAYFKKQDKRKSGKKSN